MSIIVLFSLSFLYLYVTISSAYSTYPLIGHDFSYFIPRLLDVQLFLRQSGLDIQWYSPNFAGGLPAYPNPQHTQFTVTQFFTFFFNPLIASWISFSIYFFIGVWSMYYLLNRVLKLPSWTSVFGAVFFNMNGFVFSHAVVGHITYQGFHLLPLMALAVLQPALKPFQKGLILAILIWLNIQMGGFYTLVFLFISLLISIPMILLFTDKIKVERFHHLLFWFAGFTLLLSGSKLNAILSFMRFFPRQKYDLLVSSGWSAFKSLFMQYFGTTILLPFYYLPQGFDASYFVAQVQKIAEHSYGIWEFDMALPLTVLVGILLSILYFKDKAAQFKKDILKKPNIILLSVLLFGLWLGLELRLTNGLIYPFLKTLPILSSLRVNSRFGAIFIFPLVLLSVGGFSLLEQTANIKIKRIVYFFSFLFVLCSMWVYKTLPASIYFFEFDASQVEMSYQRINEGLQPEINTVADVDDFETFLTNSSNRVAYEPLFNLENGEFAPLVKIGPIASVKNGYFNMTNPASLVFPEENKLVLFERISSTDKENLIAFINHRQPTWKRPILQITLDWLMGLTWLGILMYALWLIYRKTNQLINKRSINF